MNSLIASLRRNGLWRNNWLLGLIGVVVFVNIITTVAVVFQIQPSSTALPIRFTSLTKFDQTGSWLDFYIMGGLSWLILFINTSLAVSVYHRSRITSIMLIIVSLGLSLFILQTMTFFIGVVNGTN